MLTNMADKGMIQSRGCPNYKSYLYILIKLIPTATVPAIDKEMKK